MQAYIVFSGTGPILILTTHDSLVDVQLRAKLQHKGIKKFIGYEVDVDRVKTVYGLPFEVIAADLADEQDVRVLDFNGHHIFNAFSLDELGEPIKVDEF
jgi:hypothetical protein